ncbi:MAG: hypothetical protein PF693_12235 [Spirochaetia bacterium]|jgi:hypothetical protein|nr:hypothetical protein [Spirochaetia bacterium]
MIPPNKAQIMENWYRLDNTGKAYPLIRSNQQTTLFRLTAILTEQVNPARVKEALKKILPRFPYFQVVLKPGVFWYYFEKTNRLTPIQKDNHYPCTQYEKRWAVSPIHIYYKDNRLSLEVTHALSDGYGGMVFLKALLNSYFGENPNIENEYNLLKTPGEEEWEDAFNKYFDPSAPLPKKRSTAFHLPFPRIPPGIYYSTTGIIPLKDILTRAKADGGSLTQWLTAKYMAVLTEMIQDNNWKPAPVVINVPLDLRRLYPSKTLRNFFISLTPTIDSHVGHFSFSEILSHVKNFMSLQIDRRYIGQQFKRNINLERAMSIRLVPLFVKRIFFPFFFYHLGERSYSSGFSNLGSFNLPPGTAEKVKEVHILVPPSQGTLIKVGCISYGSQLFITFGSLTENREVEQRFFSQLRKEGIPVRIEVNY